MLGKITLKTLWCLLALVPFAMSGDLNAQTIYWGGPEEPNSTFDGGFNDWTVLGVSCSGGVAGSNALWTWGIGLGPQGGYAGSAGPIASPSAANGSVIFDSNYLDDDGVQGAFGTGTCPAPHRGELISPVIDMTGNSNVAVSFYQFYRRFAGPESSQQVPGTYIAFSSDGGTTWSADVPLNSSLAVNAATANPNKQVIDASAYADDNANFRFKFVFHGDYYFWQLDDVRLEELPAVNIAAGNFRYTLQNTSQPQSVISRDTLSFAVNVSNAGQAIDILGTVEVVNTDTEAVIHSQTKVVNVSPGTSSIIVFDDEYPLHDIEIGNYLIRYTIEDNDGGEDVDPTDNVRSWPFRVTENTTITGANQANILIAGVSSTGWGYGTSFWAPVDPNIQFRMSQVTSSFAGWTGAALMEGAESTLFVVEKGPEFHTTQPSFSNFTDDQMIIVGFAEKTFTAANHATAANPVETTYDVMRFDFEDGPVELEAGKEYFTIALLPFIEGAPGIAIRGTAAGFPSWVVDADEDGNPISGFVYTNNRIYNNDAFSANFGGRAPFYRIVFDIVTSADAPVLSELSYQVYPNPVAGDFVNLELNFDRPLATNVYITDIQGKVMSMHTFNAAQTTEQLNVSGLAAGTYFVVVSNEEGVGTRKITVVR